MKKFIILLMLSGACTFGLFAFMAFLINSDEVGMVDVEPTPVITVYQTPEDSDVNIKTHTIIEPPKPPKPMERIFEQVETNSGDDGYQITSVPITITDPGGGLDILNNVPDMDARPIVRITPKYPVDAARNGIQGWVVLAFDINTIGEVTNVKVLESQPKRIFDKAAKQALRKWKYRAKLVDGQPVSQERLTVQLDFNMEQQS